MIVGTRGHYYVRKGGLIDDFETAIQEVVGLATTELGRLMAAHGPGKELGVAPTTVNDDVPVGYNDRFGEALRLNGREVSKVAGDGYCLFHAVAIGLGRQGEGMVIHKEVLAALENRKEEIREFVNGSVEDYLDRLKGGYGDEIEIRYMKEIYNKDITIWIQDSALGATTDAMYPVVEGAIHIAYRDGVHYDAVHHLSFPLFSRDPFEPSLVPFHVLLPCRVHPGIHHAYNICFLFQCHLCNLLTPVLLPAVGVPKNYA